jgi:hypothetical protein
MDATAEERKNDTIFLKWDGNLRDRIKQVLINQNKILEESLALENAIESVTKSSLVIARRSCPLQTSKSNSLVHFADLSYRTVSIMVT